jgi:transposase
MYQGRRQSSMKGQLQAEAERERRSAPRVAAYQTVHMQYAQGTSIAAIARQLGISRPTVYAHLRRHPPPGPKRPQWRPSARVLTPYMPYLIHRWCESRADSVQLWREIQALGYTYSTRIVCRFIKDAQRYLREL